MFFCHVFLVLKSSASTFGTVYLKRNTFYIVLALNCFFKKMMFLILYFSSMLFDIPSQAKIFCFESHSSEKSSNNRQTILYNTVVKFTFNYTLAMNLTIYSMSASVNRNKATSISHWCAK